MMGLLPDMKYFVLYEIVFCVNTLPHEVNIVCRILLLILIQKFARVSCWGLGLKLIGVPDYL
jgi:hypothetical protein